MRQAVLFPQISDKTCRGGFGVAVTPPVPIGNLPELYRFGDQEDVQALAFRHGAVLLPRVSITDAAFTEVVADHESRWLKTFEQIGSGHKPPLQENSKWQPMDCNTAATSLLHCHPADQLVHLIYLEATKVGLLSATHADTQHAYSCRHDCDDYRNEIEYLQSVAGRNDRDLSFDCSVLQDSFIFSKVEDAKLKLSGLVRAVKNWGKKVQQRLSKPLALDLQEFALVIMRSDTFHARDLRVADSRAEAGCWRVTELP